jgi:hypothetical protein
MEIRREFKVVEADGSEGIATAIYEAPEQTVIAPKDKKEAAFLMPAKVDIAGFTCHAFSKARKGFVIATGNEVLFTGRHIEAYKLEHPDWQKEIERDNKVLVKERDDKIAAAEKIEDPDAKAKAITAAQDEFNGMIEFVLMNLAVPDCAFHMTALAYLCVKSPAEIAKLVGKSREYFHEQVATWADDLTDDQWDALTVRAFQELIESNIGNDYRIAEDKSGTPGAPAPKN